jgi:hypothetical protein
MKFIMQCIKNSIKLCCPLMAGIVIVSTLLGCDSDKKNTITANQAPAFFTQKGSKYIITQGVAELEIAANIAGRISSLKIAGQEMLLTPALTRSMIWGGVFWSSPQSDWFWPPVETLDSKPYQVSFENDRIIFTSDVDEMTGYQFVKSIGIHHKKNCISIKYTIYNRSVMEKNVAAWEVMRVPASGTAFFPQGNTEISSGIFYPFPIAHINDISWFTYDAKKIRDNHHKLMTDGKEGWLAYTDNGRLLIKEFDDVPVELMVAGEGEIEMWANSEKTYMEINEQSAMNKLAAGEHLDWEVLWHTRKLPENIKVEDGNAELMRYVRGVLSGEY